MLFAFKRKLFYEKLRLHKITNFDVSNKPKTVFSLALVCNLCLALQKVKLFAVRVAQFYPLNE